MPNAKFNPFPFASLVEVPVTRAERRWPKANSPWTSTPGSDFTFLRPAKTVCAACGSPKPADQSCGCFDNNGQ